MKIQDIPNYDRLTNLLCSYETLSRTEFAQLKKEIVKLPDDQQMFLVDNTLEQLQERLCYVREAVDSDEEYEAWRRCWVRLNQVEKVTSPAYDRGYKAMKDQSVWDLLSESSTEALEGYKRCVLSKKSNVLTDQERENQLIFVNKLLSERYA